MIKSITVTDEDDPLTGAKTLQRINRILQLVAAAYSDDPGTSDLDDEQPVYAVKGLDLGDVRLARRLTRAVQPEAFEKTVECDVCDNAEVISGEISERTLEDDGWYLGHTMTYCPDHAPAGHNQL
jgi:hypothetical protein